MSERASRTGTGLLAALALVGALAGCSSGSESLRDWADGEFERTTSGGSTTTSGGSPTTSGGSTTPSGGSTTPSGGSTTPSGGSTARYTDSASVSAVANKFIGFRKPIDRYETEGRTFLRYRDDIVAIFPSGSETTIEIDGSRTGRSRHFLFIGGRWGSASSYTDNIRGGGPGSGK